MKWSLLLAVSAFAACGGVEGITVDPMKDHFAEIKAKDIDKQFLHIRESGVAAVWYYKNTGGDRLFQVKFKQQKIIFKLS